MNEENEKIMSYLDKPFGALHCFLNANGYSKTGTLSDRTHGLNMVTYVAHNRTKHLKVTVWHLWLEPDQYGIRQPGYVTDIDIKDLEPKEY